MSLPLLPPPFPVPLQPVPSGRTALAAPRNATACGNIPLAATPRRGAASAGLHTGAPAARKVRAASRETESNRSPAPLQVGPPPRPRSCSRRRETKLQFLSSDDYLFLFLSFLPLVSVCVCVCMSTCAPPDAECSPGSFGAGCQQSCDCPGGGLCDPRTGECGQRRCPAGFDGENCDLGEDAHSHAWWPHLQQRHLLMIYSRSFHLAPKKVFTNQKQLAQLRAPSYGRYSEVAEVTSLPS